MGSVRYDKDEDILDIEVIKGEYRKSVERPNGVVIDITKKGEIIGIEILRASELFSGDAKKVIEGTKPVQA